METRTWYDELKISDTEDLDEVEEKINRLFQSMFNEMMFRNMVVETKTIRFKIRRYAQEITKATYNPRKAIIGMRCTMRSATSRSYEPQAIYKNGKNTAVKWDDGTVTTVKLAADETENDYAAFTAAVAKKAIGNNSQIKKIIQGKTVNQNKK